MSKNVWQRDESWVGTEVEDSIVMLNLETGKYVSLNSTASAVWQLLEEPRTQEEIELALRSRFAVDEASCRESLAKLLPQMHELSLARPG